MGGRSRLTFSLMLPSLENFSLTVGSGPTCHSLGGSFQIENEGPSGQWGFQQPQTPPTMMKRSGKKRIGMVEETIYVPS